MASLYKAMTSPHHIHFLADRRLRIVESSSATVFQCEECASRYRHKKRLVRHINQSHKKAEYKCDICGVLFTRSDVLKRHIRKNHSVTVFTCNICHYNFKSSRRMNEHQEKYHHQTTRDAAKRVGLCQQSDHLYFPAEAGTADKGGETSRIPVHGDGQSQEPARLQVGAGNGMSHNADDVRHNNTGRFHLPTASGDGVADTSCPPMLGEEAMPSGAQPQNTQNNRQSRPSVTMLTRNIPQGGKPKGRRKKKLILQETTECLPTSEQINDDIEDISPENAGGNKKSKRRRKTSPQYENEKDYREWSPAYNAEGDDSETFREENILHSSTFSEPLCRLCGAASSEIISVFEDVDANSLLLEKIHTYLPIVMSAEDLLPTTVCIKCVNKLEICHSLVQGCIEADSMLRTILGLDSSDAQYYNYENYSDDQYITEKHEVQESGMEESYVEVEDDCNEIDSDKLAGNDKVLDKCTERRVHFAIDEKHVSTESVTDNSELVKNESAVRTVQNNGGSLRSEETEQCVSTREESSEQNPEEEAGQLQSEQLNTAKMKKKQQLNSNFKIVIVKMKENNNKGNKEELKKQLQLALSTNMKDKNTEEVLCEPSEICCTFCKEKFSSMEDLRWHEETEHADKVSPPTEKISIQDANKSVDNSVLNTSEGLKILDIKMENEGNDSCDFKLPKEFESMNSESQAKILKAINRVILKRSKLFNPVKVQQILTGKKKAKRKVRRKLFKCTVCEDTFNTMDEYRVHRKTHPPKPFQCPNCQRKFARKYRYEAHVEDGNCESSTFMCEYCGKNFKLNSSLKEHYAVHGLVEALFKCTECDKAFVSKNRLDNHMLCHKEPAFLCEICGKNLKFSASLNKHKQQHHEDMVNNTCGSCRHSFPSKKELLEHEKTHAEDSSLVCHICYKSFNTQRGLKDHVLTHTTTRLFECHLCSKAFRLRQHLRKHIRRHQKPCSYSCSVCSASLMSIHELLVHRRGHTVEEKTAQKTTYLCDVCGKQFISRQSLKNHVSIHVEGKSLSCEICTKSFPSARHLAIHTRCHRHKTRNWPCSHCNMTFFSRVGMEGHERIHTGEKPFECNSCGKAFRTRSSLNTHMMTHSGYRPFKCSVCDKSFIRQDSVVMHMRTHSEMRPFVCQLCDKAYKMKQDLLKHHRKHHAGVIV